MHSIRKSLFALCCFIIASVTFFTFIPSLDNGFVNRDDPAYVTDNPAIRGCTPNHITKIFSSTYVSHYLPVTMLSYMAEYSFLGLNPDAFHRTNLILHCINSLLVFVLIFILARRRNSPVGVFAAIIGALLFAVHPLRVEPVAWIAERKELLSACFYLISLLLYLSYKKHGKRVFYFLCLGTFIISLLSKTMSVSLPIVLILLDYLNGRKIDRKSLCEKAPFFLLSALFCGIAYCTAQSVINEYQGYSVLGRLFMPGYAVMFYLVKTIVPVNLCASYYLPQTFDNGMIFLMGIATVAVLGIAGGLYYTRNFSRKLVFGALFFIVTILPVLQIINSGGLVLVADRYTYIPIIGLCYLVSEGLTYLICIRLKNNRTATAILYLLAVFIIAFLCILSWQRCSVWKNSRVLWNSIVEHEPSAPQAYDGRGIACRDAGQYEAALADFGKEIDLKPDGAAGYFGRGYTWCSCLGCPDLAIADLKKAISLAPKAPDAWNTLGIVFAMKGICDSALFDFNTAINLKSDFAEAYVNRGNAWITCFKEYDRAISDFSQALDIDPGLNNSWFLRGMAFTMKGDFAASLPDLDKAIDNNRNNPEAFFYRGLAYSNLGQSDRAVSDLNAAILLNPEYAGAYNQRGVAFATKGLYNKAIDDFAKSITLDPGAAAPRRNRDMALEKLRQTQNAK